jgi:eukaryotic-like serine/threonine-protein kinase
VYRATQLGLGRAAALKVIAAEYADNVDFRNRFTSEAQLAASIDHPNVVRVNRGFHVGGVMDALRAGRWNVLAELSGERPLLAGAPTGAA